MSYDLKTVEGVTAYMSAATSEKDWNSRCDRVKQANGGYPRFWFQTIILSGIYSTTASTWG